MLIHWQQFDQYVFLFTSYVSALILLVKERHLTGQKKWSSSLSKLKVSVLEQLLESWSNLDPKQQSVKQKQEAQLMLTNPRNAFRGQSRSPNIVPFHMLGIVSSCAIVTWSLKRTVFPIFDFKKCRDIEIWVRGHRRSLKVVTFYRFVYGILVVFFSNFVPKHTVFVIFDFKNAVTLKTELGVCQGHWKYHHSIERIRHPDNVL